MLYKRGGDIWWYKFNHKGKDIRESTRTTSKTKARVMEENRRRDLREGHIIDDRKERNRFITDVVTDHYRACQTKGKSTKYMRQFVDEQKLFMKHFAGKTVDQLNPDTIDAYETLRFNEGVSANTVAKERGILLRALGHTGKRLRVELTSIKVEESLIGRAYTADEQRRMLEAATRVTPGRREKESPLIEFALRLQLNGGFRDGEIRSMRWKQVDLLKHIVQVGKAKTRAGSGRRVPMNAKLRIAFETHAAWYISKFGKLEPESFVFPFGRPFEMDPTRPVTTFKTAWNTIKRNAGVEGRWHDCRHTFITECLESGMSAATLKSLVGHVSQRMLDHYSHANIERARDGVEALDAYRERELQKFDKSVAEQIPATDTKPHTVN